MTTPVIVGDLKYTFNENTATVLGLSDLNKTEITIPKTVTDNSIEYTVTAIANNAFDNEKNNIKLKIVFGCVFYFHEFDAEQYMILSDLTKEKQNKLLSEVNKIRSISN